MTWTMEDVRLDLAVEVYGYEIEMHCPACETTQCVLFDDRFEGPWAGTVLQCDECGGGLAE